MFRVAPVDEVSDRREAGAWFRAWRKKSGLTAGFYGVRLVDGAPDVLLVLPAGGVPAGAVSDRCVTLVAADVSLDDAIDWYVDMFLEEITSWDTPEEMLDLLAAVKGRRRFQGFGKYYASNRTEETDEEQLSTGEPKKLYRAAGGSAKGASTKLACPICTSPMKAVGIALNANEITWNRELGCYTWGTGPPAEKAVA